MDLKTLEKKTKNLGFIHVLEDDLFSLIDVHCTGEMMHHFTEGRYCNSGTYTLYLNIKKEEIKEGFLNKNGFNIINDNRFYLKDSEVEKKYKKILDFLKKRLII